MRPPALWYLNFRLLSFRHVEPELRKVAKTSGGAVRSLPKGEGKTSLLPSRKGRGDKIDSSP